MQYETPLIIAYLQTLLEGKQANERQGIPELHAHHETYLQVYLWIYCTVLSQADMEYHFSMCVCNVRWMQYVMIREMDMMQELFVQRNPKL